MENISPQKNPLKFTIFFGMGFLKNFGPRDFSCIQLSKFYKKNCIKKDYLFLYFFQALIQRMIRDLNVNTDQTVTGKIPNIKQISNTHSTQDLKEESKIKQLQKLKKPKNHQQQMMRKIMILHLLMMTKTIRMKLT